VAGSFAAVLLIATILNQDLLHNFEITPGYSSFFYITVFGGLAAASNAMIPPESSIYEPEKIGRELADETHYFPPEWHNKMHTNKVRSPVLCCCWFKLLIKDTHQHQAGPQRIWPLIREQGCSILPRTYFRFNGPVHSLCVPSAEQRQNRRLFQRVHAPR
jgi:autophagy-related protein 9